MRRMLCAGMALVLVSGIARGQDDPKPDQLKKMYADALVQLKQAQDRKNELATDNEKLNAKVADLQKQLDGAKSKTDDLTRQAAGFAERTFFLRSHYALWQDFIRRYPKLEQQWKIFMEGDVRSPQQAPDLIDTNWPLSAAAEKR